MKDRIQIAVFNMLGQQVYSTSYAIEDNQILALPGSHWPEGKYKVRFLAGQQFFERNLMAGN